MNRTKRLVYIALLTAIAMILSYVESLIPAFIPSPGAKIGLPNIVTLLALDTLGMPIALLIVIARVLLTGFMFGSMSAILYSLAGGILSWLVMGFLFRIKKDGLSIYFISIMGAISHNVGQLIVAALVIQNKNLFLYYLPFLLLIAIPTGLLIGVIGKRLLRYLKKTLPST